MYSPRIYESQIPCLYHAAQSLEVSMTQLANAFVYYGLIAGYYGQDVSGLIPQPNQILPEGVRPKMQIFNPRYSTISDYMHDLPPLGTLNPFFQTLKELGSMSTPIAVKWEKENEKIPF
jgi:hypothetical protein